MSASSSSSSPCSTHDAVQIESLATGRERALAFPAAAGQVELPIVQDEVVEAGTPYTRFRFPARATVTRPGALDLDPVMVAASLEVGTQRDRFGFPTSAYDLFRAEGERRRLVVRALPLDGRPASFENAIGSGFSIDVQASRTVVQVGDPIELNITIRGDGPLEGLSLPGLGGEDGLPSELFSVPDTAVVGIVDADDNSKTFDVTVRVRSAEANEIPPLAFSYFDPANGSYATARSRPIAPVGRRKQPRRRRRRHCRARRCGGFRSVGDPRRCGADCIVRRRPRVADRSRHVAERIREHAARGLGA